MDTERLVRGLWQDADDGQERRGEERGSDVYNMGSFMAAVKTGQRRGKVRMSQWGRRMQQNWITRENATVSRPPGKSSSLKNNEIKSFLTVVANKTKLQTYENKLFQAGWGVYTNIAEGRIPRPQPPAIRSHTFVRSSDSSSRFSFAERIQKTVVRQCQLSTDSQTSHKPHFLH